MSDIEPIGHSCRRCGSLVPVGQADCEIPICRDAYARGCEDTLKALQKETTPMAQMASEITARFVRISNDATIIAEQRDAALRALAAIEVLLADRQAFVLLGPHAMMRVENVVVAALDDVEKSGLKISGRLRRKENEEVSE
jgi:hypothetical protein